MMFIRISRHANVRALMGRSNVREVLLGHVDLSVDGIGKGEVQKEQRLLSQLEGNAFAIRALGRIGQLLRGGDVSEEYYFSGCELGELFEIVTTTSGCRRPGGTESRSRVKIWLGVKLNIITSQKKPAPKKSSVS